MDMLKLFLVEEGIFFLSFHVLNPNRYLAHIYAKDFKEKSSAERQSVNSICQGSAADVAKKAMVDITKFIMEKKLKSKMVLQIHDELMFEVPYNEVQILLVFIVMLFAFLYNNNVLGKPSKINGLR